MKKLFKTSCIGVILFISITAIAQNSITGTVTDINNNALVAVEIYTPEIHKGTITDKEGKFALHNLPTGNIKLLITSYGFENQQITINTKEQNNLSIQLKEAVFQIDEVILSTLFNKLQQDNVTKVDYKSINTILQQGGITLMENLTSILGVSQITTGSAIGKPVIRGLSGNRVVVYANGIRVENQQFGDEHGLGLNAAGFESVEIIKGPASLLYGSDAIGGVLYFTPEKFVQSGITKADLSHQYFSNTNGSNTNLGIKTSSENWKFIVRGTYSSHLDYKTPNDGRINNSRYNESDFKTRVGYSNSLFSSNLSYNYTETNLGIPEEYDIQSTSRTPAFPSQNIKQHLISSHNHFYLTKGKIEANLGYLINDRNEFESESELALAMKLNTFNYDLKYHFPTTNKLETIIGIQGMNQENSNYGEELLIPDATINDFGTFATLNYTLNKLTYQGGIRFDYRTINTQQHGEINEEGYRAALNKSFNSFNTAIGLKYNVKQNAIFRLNFASGFRAPNLAELTSNGVHEGSNRFEVGNEFLKNEQNFQTDISFEYNTEHLEFFANGFYNYINDYIFLNPTNTTIESYDVYNYVQGNSNLYGGEIGIHFHPHPLDWLHFETSFESVYGKQTNGNYLPLIPANQLNNTVKFTFNPSKSFKNSFAAFHINNTFKQQNVSEFETPSKKYTLLNLSSGSTITLSKVIFDVSLNIQNLGNKSYIPHLSRLKADEIPAMGRNYSLGLKFNL